MDFSAAAKCDVSYKSLDWPDARTITQTALYSVDFSKVDPLSIKVSYDTTSSLHWQLHTWDVTISGTNEGPLGEWGGVKRDQTGLPDPKKGIKPDLLEISCGPNEKHCTPVSGSFTTVLLFFDDQEVAKRFARAAFHASVLCGGTKAVSPF